VRDRAAALLSTNRPALIVVAGPVKGAAVESQAKLGMGVDHECPWQQCKRERGEKEKGRWERKESCRDTIHGWLMQAGRQDEQCMGISGQKQAGGHRVCALCMPVSGEAMWFKKRAVAHPIACAQRSSSVPASCSVCNRASVVDVTGVTYT